MMYTIVPPGSTQKGGEEKQIAGVVVKQLEQEDLGKQTKVFYKSKYHTEKYDFFVFIYQNCKNSVYGETVCS